MATMDERRIRFGSDDVISMVVGDVFHPDAFAAAPLHIVLRDRLLQKAAAAAPPLLSRAREYINVVFVVLFVGCQKRLARSSLSLYLLLPSSPETTGLHTHSRSPASCCQAHEAKGLARAPLNHDLA